MNTRVHGTFSDPNRRHPVLDQGFWERLLPPKVHPFGIAPDYVDGPGDLVLIEWARREAQRRGSLGPSVPTDVFLWSCNQDDKTPWLTRLGGIPWRAKGKPWPRDNDGRPLVFLGQISFVDSKDLLPFPLPGDVALVFGAYHEGHVWLHDGSALEWSSLSIDKQAGYGDIPWGCCLPVQYQGVIHRTVQYTDSEVYDEKFLANGWRDEGFQIGAVQATSIGAYGSLPQGWPFREGDGNELVCVLSSFYSGLDLWPCVDLPVGPRSVDGNGKDAFATYISHATSFQVGDCGAIWVYRDKRGEFHLDEACG